MWHAFLEQNIYEICILTSIFLSALNKKMVKSFKSKNTLANHKSLYHKGTGGSKGSNQYSVQNVTTKTIQIWTPESE